MKAKPVDGHHQATQFCEYIGAPSQLCDVLAPVGEYCFALRLVGPNAQRAPEMVEDDGRIRKCLRQVDQLGNLWVVEPCVEREPAFSEFRIALAKG